MEDDFNPEDFFEPEEIELRLILTEKEMRQFAKAFPSLPVPAQELLWD